MADTYRARPRSAWKIPLPSVLILPFIIQVSVAVGLVGYFSYRYSQESVEDLTNQLIGEVSQQVRQKFSSYLEPARLVNQLNSDAVRRGDLKLNVAQIDRKRDQYLLQNMQLFKNLIWISLGSENGDAMGIVRPEDHTGFQIAASNRSTKYFGTYHIINDQGQRIKQHKVTPRPFDPRTRPWYKDAIAAKGPIWTQIYAGFTPGRILISAAQPLYDSTGKLQGVSSTDISLFDLKTFLAENPVSPQGQVFVIERSGLLIASSNPQDHAFRGIKGKNLERVSAFDSNTPLIRATMHSLRQQMGDFNNLQQLKITKVKFHQDTQFVKVIPLSQEKGLDWLIVIVVPESDVMAKIHAGNQTTLGLCMATFVGVLLVNALVSHRLVKPIKGISQASQEIAHGNFQYHLSPSNIQELSILADSFNQMSQEIQQSRNQLEEYSRSLEQKVEERTQELRSEIEQRVQAETALREANQQLKRMAYIDGLTQIPNRRWFDQRLLQEWSRLKREEASLAVILCDVDYFKQYNDTYGHQMGDECLRDVARALLIAARRPSDVVARYGGEEFVVLLPNTNLAGAMVVAEAMQSTVRELKLPHQKSQVSPFVTISFGLASVVPSDDLEPDVVLIHADRALYQAKAKGRDRIEIG